LSDDRLGEPELSVYRRFHREIERAAERLSIWQSAWETAAPVLLAPYGLGPEDEIDPEGVIHRKADARR
jgi:hypothetical protein